MARRNDLITRIALSGGADIEKDLRAIGKVGEEAFEKLARAADESNKGMTLNAQAMRQLREELKAIGRGFQEIGNAGRDFGNASRAFATNLRNIGIAVVGAAAGLLAFTKNAADAADEIVDTSVALGLSTDAFQRLAFTFQQNGANSEIMTRAFNRLNISIKQAADGTGRGAEIFQRLGIRVKGANGQLKSTDVIFSELADAFAKLPDGAYKSGLAIEIFGRTGSKVVQVLNQGADGIKRFGDEAVAAGLVIDEATLAIGAKFNDTLDKTIAIMANLRTQIGLTFAPGLTEFLEALSQLLIDNRDALVSFGQAAADFVVPILRDLIAIFQGREADVVNRWILDVIKLTGDFIVALQFLADVVGFAFESLVEAVNLVVGPINALFGTDIQARTIVIIGLVSALTGGFKLLASGIKLGVVAFQTIAKFAGLFTAKLLASIVGAVLAVGTFTEAIQRLFADAFQFVDQAFASAFGSIFAGLDKFLSLAKEVADHIIKLFSDVASAIGAAWAALTGGGEGDSGDSGGGSPPAMKKGGRIRGRGTGTSDSVLIRASNGEYMVRAAAVRKYGTNFLNSLNAMRLPKFAMGGLVDGLTQTFAPNMMLPSYANGGAVSGSSNGGGNPITLNIGGEVFEGLIADDAVAAKLRRFAAGKQLRRAGKTPSWHRS